MVLSILEELAANGSRNAKLAIIEQHKDNPLFMSVVQAALDMRKMYYIKKLPEYHYEGTETISLEEGLKRLDKLSERVYTGNEALTFLKNTLAHMAEDDATVLKRVVLRDLRCGVAASTVNKVVPGAVYDHPYMRCNSFSKKNLQAINFPAYSQTKADGMYCDLYFNQVGPTFRSRSGTKINVACPNIDVAVSSSGIEGVVFQGELLVLDHDGAIMPREKGNGLLNSEEFLQNESHRIIFQCWDAVSLLEHNKGESKSTYQQRFTDLMVFKQRIDSVSHRPFFYIIESRIVESIEDAAIHFQENLKKGLEGTIVKDFKGKWKNGTSKHQVKMKVIIESELKVVGVKEGTGKHEGMLGAILCQSACGQLEVSVGSGFKDTERATFWDEQESLIGKVVTVRYNDIMYATETDKVHSMFLPRFVEVREDKHVADDLAKIEADRQAALQLGEIK